jgi:tRNA(Ser,Leu) C12 N-acetylase TAN1
VDYNKYVSTSIKRMRKRLKQTDDKDEQRMSQVQDILDIGIQQFGDLIKRGKVKMDAATFEKFVKMQMLMMDRPTEIVENRSDVDEIQETQMREIESSPEFESLKEQIASMMNAHNEEDKRK